MKIDLYKDNKKDFADDTLDILRGNEVQNNVLIKIANRFKNGEYKEDWYCASVKDNGGGVMTAAVCTPPHNLVIYETGNRHDGAALNLLARELYNAGYEPPGVLGEQVTAELFAESYAQVSGRNKRAHMSLNAMQLLEVSKISGCAPGFMREICADDICFAPYWELEFVRECNIDPWTTLADTVNSFNDMLGKRKHYIWIDKTPVATASFMRENFEGASISKVYTPPFYRGRGYCTALMARLSQDLLGRGYKYCCLFADADYPESNKVYRKIGYKDICLYREIKFEQLKFGRGKL